MSMMSDRNNNCSDDDATVAGDDADVDDDSARWQHTITMGTIVKNTKNS